MNLDIQWIVGYIDSKGQFIVHLRENNNESTVDKPNFQILPEFKITTHSRDIQILYALKRLFKCGVVIKEEGLNQNSCSFIITKIPQLHANVLPFFEKHKLKSKTRVDFEKFRLIIRLLMENKHFTLEGFHKIARLVKDLDLSKGLKN